MLNNSDKPKREPGKEASITKGPRLPFFPPVNTPASAEGDILTAADNALKAVEQLEGTVRNVVFHRSSTSNIKAREVLEECVKTIAHSAKAAPTPPPASPKI